MKQKFSIDLFTIPIICLFITLIIVLTFFLINSLKVRAPGVELPKETAKELKYSEISIITISKDGSLSINDIKLKQDIIPQGTLSELRNAEVFIRADKKVEYGKIFNILNQLKKANIKAKLVSEPISNDKKISKSNLANKIIELPPFSESILSKLSKLKIQNHIKKCWSINPSFLDLKTNIILRINLNKDMSVSKVDVKDKEKYLNNSKYKVIADGAIRAVLACSPLPLDNSDYATLKEFEMEFNTDFMDVR